MCTVSNLDAESAAAVAWECTQSYVAHDAIPQGGKIVSGPFLPLCQVPPGPTSCE